jgi:hypothetical protein
VRANGRRAEFTQDARQRLLVVGVDDLGGRQLCVRIHPHVQRGVCRVGETALGAVKLHRRNAEVEQDSVDFWMTGFACPVTGFGENVLDPVESGAGQQDTVGERREALTGDPQGVWIAVKADQPQAGQFREEPLGVPARPQGRIHQHGSGAVGAAPRQCGREQFDAEVEQDRDVSVVPRRPAGCVSHGKASDERRPCTGVSVRARGPGVGEVRQGRLGQRPRCTDSQVPIR